MLKKRNASNIILTKPDLLDVVFKNTDIHMLSQKIKCRLKIKKS